MPCECSSCRCSTPLYADRGGHILYVYNAAPPIRAKGDYRFWEGVVPGDQSALIWSKLHPYADLPQVIDPPNGFVQNCNDPPWTSTYPMQLDPSKFAPYLAPRSGITERSQRSIRLLSQSVKISFDDLKADKLSTRAEMADHFVDDLVAQARKLGGDQVRKAADILEQWDRQAEANSDGTLLFYRFMLDAGSDFRAIGGYAVPPDDRQPLTTPRGFADPVKAVQFWIRSRAASSVVTARYITLGRCAPIPARSARLAGQWRAVPARRYSNH